MSKEQLQYWGTFGAFNPSNPLNYIPGFAAANSLKRETAIFNELRNQKPSITNTTVNNNLWNQQYLNVQQGDEFLVINIYEAPVAPNLANYPYLKSEDYLNPLGESAGSNQTPYSTPKDTPITLSAQLAEDKQTYGKLTYNPESSQLKQQIRSKPNNEFYDQEIEKHQEQSRKAILSRKFYHVNPDKEKPDNIDNAENQGFLIIPSNLKSNSGNGEFLCGISTISAIAQKYRANSTIGLLPPTNEIPKEIEIIETQDNYQPLIFEDRKLNIDATDPQTLLGFEVFDSFESSIEDKLIELGKKQYEDQDNPYGTGNKTGKLTSLGEYLTHLISVMFYRSGFHRLPSLIPKLNPKKEINLEDSKKLSEQIKQIIETGDLTKLPKEALDFYEIIEDNIDFQSYLINSIDSLLGKFPLKLKIVSEKGEPTELIIPNLAEATTELIGACLNINKNSETLMAVAVKGLLETIYLKQLNETDSDMIRAIVDYLGFQTEEKEEELTIPINPEATTMEEFLKDSTYKVLGIENAQKTTLIEELKLISLAAQITKSSQGFKQSVLPGDAIKEQKKKDRERFDKEWDKFINSFNNPQSVVNNRYPNVKIRDKSDNT
jgi:hypothetical protein